MSALPDVGPRTKVGLLWDIVPCTAVNSAWGWTGEFRRHLEPEPPLLYFCYPRGYSRT